MLKCGFQAGSNLRDIADPRSLDSTGADPYTGDVYVQGNKYGPFSVVH